METAICRSYSVARLCPCAMTGLNWEPTLPQPPGNGRVCLSCNVRDKRETKYVYNIYVLNLIFRIVKQ